MTRRVITLDPCLAGFIDRNMPDVGGVANITFLCCDEIGDFPFDSLRIFSSTLRDRQGFTLGRTIYLREPASGCCPLNNCNFVAVQLILHELCHAESFNLSIFFAPLYVLQLILFGYRRHPDEVAADARSIALRMQYQTENPCNCPRPAVNPPPPPPPPATARVLTPAEIEGCCGSPRDQNPTIEFSVTRTAAPPASTRITIVVTARQNCGVNSLIVRPALSQGAIDTSLPVQTSPGSDCLTFRTLTVTRVVQPGASLKVVAEATSCCDKTGTNTAVVSA